MSELHTVSIEGERFFADLVGYTPSDRLACLGLVGNRTGLERALVMIHRGHSIVIDHKEVNMLGEGLYKVDRATLSQRLRLARAWVLPTSAVQQVRKSRSDKRSGNGPTEDKADAQDIEQVLVWRVSPGASETDGERALWAWIKNRSPIPVLEEWRIPVLHGLRQAMVTADDSPTAESNTDSDQPVLGSVRFAPAGDGRWRGVVINLTEAVMARVVQQALRAGDIRIPGEEPS